MKNIPVVNSLVDQILDLCNPIKIFLYNVKFDLNHAVSSFKICVIVEDDVDTAKLESTLYLKLECDNPFDVLIYRQNEWDSLIADDASFASKIKRSGVVLYELSI